MTLGPLRLRIAAASILLLSRTFALAAPVVTVKGHTTIRLFGIHATAGGAVLTGQLQDRDLGTGVTGRQVMVSYRDSDRTRTLRTTTAEDGMFQVVLSGGGGTFQVEARFGGDFTYAEENYSPETLDVSKQSLELELVSDRETPPAPAISSGSRRGPRDNRSRCCCRPAQIAGEILASCRPIPAAVPPPLYKPQHSASRVGSACSYTSQATTGSTLPAAASSSP